MALNRRAPAVLLHTFVGLLLSCSVSYGTLTDIYCLKTIKASLEDSLQYLNTSWNFGNYSEGIICKFTGIECWHPDESRALNIRLSDMGLKGQFPRGIENCTSLTGLDLSSNKLSGPIPTDIYDRLKFVTSLDLSSNSFSGEIPLSLVNCTYLNILKLDYNRLTGSIPLQFGQITRLKTFSVSNNLLSGQVPTFPNGIVTAESYANNPGLCGKPLLNACKAPAKKSHTGVIAGSAVGGVTVTILVVGIVLYFVLRYCHPLRMAILNYAFSFSSLRPEAKAMEWPLRLKIGIGAARGLAWLHHNCNPRIIHRNISSKCILLDENFEPKISDFGLARLMNPVDTHLSTFVNGDFGDMGYVAPEYLRTLVATPKGDIYSFGTVLLELVTGDRETYPCG
ncbi:hypothetical protein HHK36_027321 [Tetracentron sinense]|uniref:Protein kinase domain-containing protein n=1 Tax=Tetracentron sinense TaxID=13715 RepID=A0A834YHC5_TETSI|nr:hypothetical protein HHK36_027321 [Tetracentron sinense]